MNIKGKLVTLRAPEFRDIELLHKWSNEPEIWKMLGGWHFPFSTRSTEAWIRSQNDGSLDGHVFCIDAPETGLIGTANLIQIDWKNRNAFHGMMLGDVDTRGKGYALDAVMAIMRYAFEELGLERLDTDIIEYNSRSLKFYIDKCGWVKEGVKKNFYFRNGSFHDKVIVGITKDNYIEHLKNTQYWLI